MRKIAPVELDDLERLLINELQGGFPVSDRPFLEVALRLGSDEETVLKKIKSLTERGVLSRFGPMYHAEKMGGGLTLAALSIPEDDFERINQIVNAFDEVAHNYKREHELNMWFVLATETPERVQECCDEIAVATGYHVYNMPKKQEFFIGLRFEA